MMTQWSRTFILGLLCLSLASCASVGRSIKNFVSGKSSDESAATRTKKDLKFSDVQSLPYGGKDRQYQRMTREKLEQDARIEDNTGSLWVMEGQGSYLFSSNTLRLVGDIVNVKIEGSPKSQLETKVKVIKTLLAKLEKPKRKPAALAPGQQGQQPQAQGKNDPNNPQQPGQDQNVAQKDDDDKDEKDKEKEEEVPFLVDVVPARIIDRTAEGYYRVKGSQTFMIGRREYRVIVTGLVRPGDVNGEEVDAGQMLEPKLDIVSQKKEIKL